MTIYRVYPFNDARLAFGLDESGLDSMSISYHRTVAAVCGRF
jgi:hypothetical protein